MDSFVHKHAGIVAGVLSGFDRLVFRGTLRTLAFTKGMMGYLWAAGVLLKDFRQHAEEVTRQLKAASLEQAERTGREIRYLSSSRTRKENVARKIAERDGIDAGLICVLKCVEPCMSYEVHRNDQTRKLELRPGPRKCLHLYHYIRHPVFGFMNARIQTWFPFSIQVCINGREWLGQQMDEAGLGYQRRDNCFTHIDDFDAAQTLANQQLRAPWPKLLDGIVDRIHPAHRQIFPGGPLDYYWSTHQSEWATDVTFRSREDLTRIYPRLVRHGITTFGSSDVMRFLGRKVRLDGHPPANFSGEVVSDVNERPEGICIRHRLNGNSVKMYDKWSNLRFETTINNPRDFKVYRPKESDPDGPLDWRPMRKGIADLHRRAQVSQAANERLMEAQAAVSNDTPLKELADALCRPVRRAGRPKANGQGRTKARRFRALNPLSVEDAALLTAVSRPEFNQNGFRNRDLCALLFPTAPACPGEQRRRSASVTRKIGLLRAHGLIRRVPKTHRYTVTANGRLAMTALLAARNASTDLLTKAAA